MGGSNLIELPHVFSHELKVGIETEFERLRDLRCSFLGILYFFGKKVGGELIQWVENVLRSYGGNIIGRRFGYQFIDMSSILLRILPLWCLFLLIGQLAFLLHLINKYHLSKILHHQPTSPKTNIYQSKEERNFIVSYFFIAWISNQGSGIKFQ